MGQPTLAFVFSNSSQFVPVTTGGQLCTPDLVMFSDGGGDVTLSGPTSMGSPITLPPPGQPNGKRETLPLYQAASATITVARGRAPNFAFWVCDGTGNYQAYFLAGVALQNATRSGSGIAQFPKVDVGVSNGATSLQLTDRNQDANAYEFFVLVQNAAGQLGLIDPRIINQTG